MNGEEMKQKMENDAEFITLLRSTAINIGFFLSFFRCYQKTSFRSMKFRMQVIEMLKKFMKKKKIN
jgi:hypothetical protein